MYEDPKLFIFTSCKSCLCSLLVVAQYERHCVTEKLLIEKNYSCSEKLLIEKKNIAKNKLIGFIFNLGKKIFIYQGNTMSGQL